MELADIRKHWEGSARQGGASLAATTRTSTIKRLEIDALGRAIKRFSAPGLAQLRVLEAGCGNGYNCLGLAAIFTAARFVGFDYVDDMVASAADLAAAGGVADRCSFARGDLLALGTDDGLGGGFDVVFTDRAIINLNSEPLQRRAVEGLAAKVRTGGLLLVLENFIETYEKQNQCRKALGLPAREPAAFNRFLSGESLLRWAAELGLAHLHTDDFGSLHDLMLYVLVPAANGGAVDYGHPLVEHATVVSEAALRSGDNPFGSFGQNRLFVFARR
jgi:predicted O-methyltransferase YrrM